MFNTADLVIYKYRVAKSSLIKMYQRTPHCCNVRQNQGAQNIDENEDISDSESRSRGLFEHAHWTEAPPATSDPSRPRCEDDSTAQIFSGDHSRNADNGVIIPGANTRKSSNMATRLVARRRKSAQTRSQSANISRKRRKGGGSFSRKMVISSGITGPQGRKLIERSPVSTNPNQPSRVIAGVQGVETVQRPLHPNSLRVGFLNEASHSESPPLILGSPIKLSPGEKWYTESISPDSGNLAIVGSEYCEQYGDIDSGEPPEETFNQLRRQQLIVDKLTFPEAEEVQHRVLRTQRLDLLSSTIDDCMPGENFFKAKTNVPSWFRLSLLSEPHSRFDSEVDDSPIGSDKWRSDDADDALLTINQFDRFESQSFCRGNQDPSSEELPEEPLFRSRERKLGTSKYTSSELLRLSPISERDTKLGHQDLVELPYSPTTTSKANSFYSRLQDPSTTNPNDGLDDHNIHSWGQEYPSISGADRHAEPSLLCQEEEVHSYPPTVREINESSSNEHRLPICLAGADNYNSKPLIMTPETKSLNAKDPKFALIENWESPRPNTACFSNNFNDGFTPFALIENWESPTPNTACLSNNFDDGFTPADEPEADFEVLHAFSYSGMEYDFEHELEPPDDFPIDFEEPTCNVASNEWFGQCWDLSFPVSNDEKVSKPVGPFDSNPIDDMFDDIQRSSSPL